MREALQLSDVSSDVLWVHGGCFQEPAEGRATSPTLPPLSCIRLVQVSAKRYRTLSSSDGFWSGVPSVAFSAGHEAIFSGCG